MSVVVYTRKVKLEWELTPNQQLQLFTIYMEENPKEDLDKLWKTLKAETPRFSANTRLPSVAGTLKP